jgi:hypothetical protein
MLIFTNPEISIVIYIIETQAIVDNVRIAGGMFDKAMQNIGRPNSDA